MKAFSYTHMQARKHTRHTHTHMRHVDSPHVGYDTLEEVWSLISHSTHQQTTIRPTMDGNPQKKEEYNNHHTYLPDHTHPQPHPSQTTPLTHLEGLVYLC